MRPALAQAATDAANCRRSPGSAWHSALAPAKAARSPATPLSQEFSAAWSRPQESGVFATGIVIGEIEVTRPSSAYGILQAILAECAFHWDSRGEKGSPRIM